MADNSQLLSKSQDSEVSLVHVYPSIKPSVEDSRSQTAHALIWAYFWLRLGMGENTSNGRVERRCTNDDDVIDMHS